MAINWIEKKKRFLHPKEQMPASPLRSTAMKQDTEDAFKRVERSCFVEPLRADYGQQPGQRAGKAYLRRLVSLSTAWTGGQAGPDEHDVVSCRRGLAAVPMVRRGSFAGSKLLDRGPIKKDVESAYRIWSAIEKRPRKRSADQRPRQKSRCGRLSLRQCAEPSFEAGSPRVIDKPWSARFCTYTTCLGASPLRSSPTDTALPEGRKRALSPDLATGGYPMNPKLNYCRRCRGLAVPTTREGVARRPRELVVWHKTSPSVPGSNLKISRASVSDFNP